MQSLVPIYAKVCADMLVSSLNDAGRLGILARAVMSEQLKRSTTGDLQQPAPSWQSNNSHMLLRQLATLTQSGLKLRFDAQSIFLKECSGLHDLVSSMVGFRPLHIDFALVTQHILHPLWRQGVHVLTPLVTGSTWKSLPQIMQSFPHWPPDALRAYSLLLALCCTPAHHFHQQCAAEGICPAPASLHLHLPSAFTEATQVACAQHILRFVDAAQSQHW